MEFNQYPEDIRFDKYWLILRHHWVPATSVFILIMLLATATAALQKPLYEAQGKLLFKKRNTASTLLAEGPDKVGELDSLNQQNSPVDTEAEILRSAPIPKEAIEILNLKDTKGEPLTSDDLIKNLTVKGIKGTDILLISYRSADPKEAAEVVNQLVNLYIKNNLLTSRRETIATRDFINESLPRTESQLRYAESELRDFEEKNKVVNLTDEATATVTSISELNKQIVTAKAGLDNATAQTVALGNEVGRSTKAALAVNSLSQSPAIQGILTQLQQVTAQLAIERVRFQDSNPLIVRLEEREVALKSLLQELATQVIGTAQPVSRKDLQAGQSEQKLIESFVQAEVTQMGLTSQVNSLIQAQTAYQERASLLPRLQQQQKELERQVATIQSKYDVLVKRGQEVLIAENQNIGNARIVASASAPNQPIESKKKLILVGGAVIGGLLYILTAFVLDSRDPSIKTVREIREILKYPRLGTIPLDKRNQGTKNKDSVSAIPELPVRNASQALVSEAYRMLQSNLKLLNPDATVKTIVVTSSISKEGKSTVSANLAIALAQMQHKVLLIDADLHHPVQHHIWQLTNDKGLTNVILCDTELSEAVREVQEYLTVLPSGVIPSNPLTLLDSNHMATIIHKVSQNYDFVIVDTPPLILVSDVLTISKLADGLLLVVRPGVIDSESIEITNELLAQSQLKVLGLVVNGVIAEDEPKGYLQHARRYHEESVFSKSNNSQVDKLQHRV